MWQDGSADHQNRDFNINLSSIQYLKHKKIIRLQNIYNLSLRKYYKELQRGRKLPYYFLHSINKKEKVTIINISYNTTPVTKLQCCKINRVQKLN